MIEKSKDCEVERIKILKEFKNKIINYIKHQEANINGYQCLYDIKDIEVILDGALNSEIINEDELLEVIESDYPF
jgi:hypothetical protein